MRIFLLWAACVLSAFAASAPADAQTSERYFSCIDIGGSTDCSTGNSLRKNVTSWPQGTVVTVGGWNAPGDGGGGDFVVGPQCDDLTVTGYVHKNQNTITGVTGVITNIRVGSKLSDTLSAIPPGAQIAAILPSTIVMTLSGIMDSPAASISVAGDNGGTLIKDSVITPHANCYYKTNYQGDPHEWGAYGDGQADDTAALQEWLGAYGIVPVDPPTLQRTAFGPWTAIMPGSYMVDTPLVCPKNATIQGPANLDNDAQPVFAIQAFSATLLTHPFSGFLPANDTEGAGGAAISAQAVIGALDHCRLSGVSVVGNQFYLPVVATLSSSTPCITVTGSPIGSIQIGSSLKGSNIDPHTNVAPKTTCTGGTQIQVTKTPTCTCTENITFYGPDAVDVLGDDVTIDGFSGLTDGTYDLSCIPTAASPGRLQVSDSFLHSAMDTEFSSIDGACQDVTFTGTILGGAGLAEGTGTNSVGVYQFCGANGSAPSLTCDGDDVHFSGTGLTIAGGVIEEARGNGIWLNGASHATISAMHIQGNGEDTAGGYGIYLSNVHTLSICGNHLEGNGGDVSNSAQVYLGGSIDSVNLCGNTYESQSKNNAALVPLYVYDADPNATITNTHIYDAPAPQAGGQVYSSNALTVLPQLQVPHVSAGQISGLTMANGSPATQINISPGEASDSSNSVTIVSPNSCSVDIQYGGVHGLDAGASMQHANTTYLYFLIATASGGNPSCMASTNLAPDLSLTSYSQNYVGQSFAPTTSISYLYNLNSIAGIAPGQVVFAGGSPIGTITSVGTLTSHLIGTIMSLGGTSYEVDLSSGTTTSLHADMEVTDVFAFSGCPVNSAGAPLNNVKTGFTVTTVVSTTKFDIQGGPANADSHGSFDCIVVSSGYTATLSNTSSYPFGTTFTIFNGVHRLVGALYTTNSGTVTVVPFLQDKNTFYLKTPVTDIQTGLGLGMRCVSSVGTSPQPCQLSIPCGRLVSCTASPNLNLEAFGRMVGGSGDILISSNLVTPPQMPTPFPTAPAYSTDSSTPTTSYPFRLYTDPGGRVRVQGSSPSNTVYEVTDGWILHR